MDKQRGEEIMKKLKDGSMSLVECLNALSEVSEDLHKLTGEQRYKNVADASAIMAYGEEQGLDEETNIALAVNYLEEK